MADARALGAMGSPHATPSALLRCAVRNMAQTTIFASQRALSAFLLALAPLPQTPKSVTDAAVGTKIPGVGEARPGPSQASGFKSG